MAGETTHKGGKDSLDSFIDSLSEVATEHFATGEVDVPVLHFLKDDGAMGVLPLIPQPGLESAQMARLVVGFYDPPAAAVLAEGWATNLALPKDINEALDGKRPWSEVAERVSKRLAPALRHYPALAEALRQGDVAALELKHRMALTYAWHEDTMGPVSRGEKSLKSLPLHLRRKVMTLFGEDRQGASKTLLWRIDRRDGRRHFVPEPMEGADQYATRWRPLYIAMEMAAQAKVPTGLVRPRVRELCRQQLSAYKLVEGIAFTDAENLFGSSAPPYMQ